MTQYEKLSLALLSQMTVAIRMLLHKTAQSEADHQQLNLWKLVTDETLKDVSRGVGAR